MSGTKIAVEGCFKMTLDREDFGNLSLYPGLEELARELEKSLGAAHRDVLLEILKGWNDLGSLMTPTQARQVVQGSLRAWPELTAARYDELINRIFNSGFMVGVLDTGVIRGPDQGDQMVVEWLKNNRRGFIPALRTFGEGERRFFEEIIEDAYAGVDVTGRPRAFDLDRMVRRVRSRSDEAKYKVERVVRTETAKATALGRIMSWENDPERDFYHYAWVATHDDRTKDVSLKFEQEGPYGFSQIKRLWMIDHNEPQLVRNRHTGRMETQTSAFNCRCTPARFPKEPRELYDEGLIGREEFAAMEAA